MSGRLPTLAAERCELPLMRIHLIAVGGSAMHNFALALAHAGHLVTGSDDQIFEPISMGFGDTSPVLREMTVKVCNGYGPPPLAPPL